MTIEILKGIALPFMALGVITITFIIMIGLYGILNFIMENLMPTIAITMLIVPIATAIGNSFNFSITAQIVAIISTITTALIINIIYIIRTKQKERETKEISDNDN